MYDSDRITMTAQFTPEVDCCGVIVRTVANVETSVIREGCAVKLVYNNAQGYRTERKMNYATVSEASETAALFVETLAGI